MERFSVFKKLILLKSVNLILFHSEFQQIFWGLGQINSTVHPNVANETLENNGECYVSGPDPCSSCYLLNHLHLNVPQAGSNSACPKVNLSSLHLVSHDVPYCCKCYGSLLLESSPKPESLSDSESCPRLFPFTHLQNSVIRYHQPSAKIALKSVFFP